MKFALSTSFKLSFCLYVFCKTTTVLSSCGSQSNLFSPYISFDNSAVGLQYSKWTKQASNWLFTQNHPLDCSSVPILLCSTRVNKFQGTGSRLFFLGRCLTEGLNSERVVVLSKELPSTHDILSPFKTWSNCSLENTKVNTKGSRIKLYHPMDSESLVKSKDMPAVGALYPKRFAERGYWWWKAQEISYALRPKLQTLKTLENMFGEKLGSMAVFQVRRTDKTHGCATVYGKNSKIKCKQEASAPQLLEFMKALQNFKEDPKNIKIVTDDAQIHAEILKIPKNGHRFLNTEPAPRRIPDKELRGGIFKGRALKDALDILTMSFGNPLIFTYSSGFGALALQIKQVRDDFCSNWSSLDWGKREWPPIGTMGEGGVRGVQKNADVVSKVCGVSMGSSPPPQENQYCSLLLKKTRDPGAAIVSLCTCESSESN